MRWLGRSGGTDRLRDPRRSARRRGRHDRKAAGSLAVAPSRPPRRLTRRLGLAQVAKALDGPEMAPITGAGHLGAHLLAGPLNRRLGPPLVDAAKAGADLGPAPIAPQCRRQTRMRGVKQGRHLQAIAVPAGRLSLRPARLGLLSHELCPLRWTLCGARVWSPGFYV